ncbi:hypothetical protein BH10BAC5_BH10BAC5_12340 [soil metagenome]
MKKLLILITFNIILSSRVYSQELYILSHPAANLAKDRIEIRNNVLSYGGFKYFHNSFELNYGITGNLTEYNSIFYTTQTGYKFLGNYEGALRFRFFSHDKKNYHVRAAWQGGITVPINSTQIVSDKVTYELHPGHVVSFYNFASDITVPVVDFHTTDNLIFKNDLIVTNLINRFSVTGEMGYNITSPKSDFKFGNYIDWTLAMGYFALPVHVKNYNQPTVNFYSEWKAYYFEKNKFQGTEVRNSGGFRLNTYFGVQTILFSSLMIEASYMLPVHSNEFTEEFVGKRPTQFLISLRYLFFL